MHTFHCLIADVLTWVRLSKPDPSDYGVPKLILTLPITKELLQLVLLSLMSGIYASKDSNMQALFTS